MYQAPALTIISDRRATGGRPLVDVLKRALIGAESFRREDGRLPLGIHLREKDLEGAAYLDLALSVAQITKSARADLFINSRLDIAIACNAEGIHLPTRGIAVVDVRAASPILRVGVSTHTSVEVVAAANAGADFVFFGPILETPSKRNLVSPRGIAGLQVVTDNEVPVLALGGITPEVTSACRAAGAAGVACIRAVLEAPDPAIVVMAFLSRFGG